MTDAEKIEELRMALGQLLALKRRKDAQGKDAEYMRLQPIVWQLASDTFELTSPTQPEPEMDERAEFEAWYKSQWPLTFEKWKAGKLPHMHDPDIVVEEDIEEMFISWQACAALSSKAKK